jgi:3-isopropylmalate/(R)-2-methylmalate dehydratase small subunit
MDAAAGGGEAEVDLEREVIVAPDGRELPFRLDPFQRHCLLNGLDDIARSLAYEDDLAAYEAAHPGRFETTAL